MILLIDNYDSFSYNLVQLAGSIVPDIKAVRNDELTVEEIEKMKPDHIILSPGPGYPAAAGICEEAALRLRGKIPILGVCLGHQAICEAYGGRIVRAEKLMHGKSDRITLTADCPLFEGLEKNPEVARYHSLIAERESLPECLEVTAVSQEGEIMAVQHRESPVYGLQFHPESILTSQGRKIMENFLAVHI